MSGRGLGVVKGYVLAGGMSTRMGRDKALLELDGVTLLRRTYELLERVCGLAAVVGPAERYGALGFPLIPDLRPGCGPLGGLEAALADGDTETEWALVVACDMPSLEAEALRALVGEIGEAGEAEVILPVSEGGRAEPLSALYRRRALEVVRKQLETGRFKLLDGIGRLRVREVHLNRPLHFLNINRPEDWEALDDRQ